MSDRPIRVLTQGRWKRVQAEDGELDVSHLSFGPIPMRAGPAGALRMAGIAGVGTDPAYRRQGLARQVFVRAMEEIRADGYSCAGLYTGVHIVAHRLYRSFGFVDVLVPVRAEKLLEPARYAQQVIGALLRGEDVAPELLSWRTTLGLRLGTHAPVLLRIEGGEVRQLETAEQVDLWLSLSDGDFILLFDSELELSVVEAGGRLRWKGRAEDWQRLASALRARRRVILGGD